MYEDIFTFIIESNIYICTAVAPSLSLLLFYISISVCLFFAFSIFFHSFSCLYLPLFLSTSFSLSFPIHVFFSLSISHFSSLFNPHALLQSCFFYSAYILDVKIYAVLLMVIIVLIRNKHRIIYDLKIYIIQRNCDN